MAWANTGRLGRRQACAELALHQRPSPWAKDWFTAGPAIHTYQQELPSP